MKAPIQLHHLGAALLLWGFASALLAQDRTPSFKIGLISSRSGSLAPFGRTLADGVRLSLETFREQYPELDAEIHMIVADDGSLASGAERAAERLVKEHKVDAIVGSFSNTLNTTLATLVQQHEVPLVLPRATDPSLFQRPYVFSLTPSDPLQGKILANMARQRLQGGQLTLITEAERPDSQHLRQGFVANWTTSIDKALDSLILEPHSAGLDSIETELKTRQTDLVVYLGSLPQGLSLMERQGHAVWVVPDTWTGMGAAPHSGKPRNILYPSYFSALDPAAGVQAFVRSFQKAYQRDPDVLAALGYESTRILLHAYQIARSLEHSSVYDILVNRPLLGISGSYKFDSSHVYLRPLPITRNIGSSLQFAGRASFGDFGP